MTPPLCKVCGRPVTGVKYGRPYATCSRECGTAARRAGLKAFMNLKAGTYTPATCKRGVAHAQKDQ